MPTQLNCVDQVSDVAALVDQDLEYWYSQARWHVSLYEPGSDAAYQWAARGALIRARIDGLENLDHIAQVLDAARRRDVAKAAERAA